MHIEEVQDLVQEELMRQGHFKVAEHYIIYRAQRSDLRAKERVEPETAPITASTDATPAEPAAAEPATSTARRFSRRAARAATG